MLRHYLYILAICLACLVPMPLVFRKKDSPAQILIEQLDEEPENEEEAKELF